MLRGQGTRRRLLSVCAKLVLCICGWDKLWNFIFLRRHLLFTLVRETADLVGCALEYLVYVKQTVTWHTLCVTTGIKNDCSETSPVVIFVTIGWRASIFEEYAQYVGIYTLNTASVVSLTHWRLFWWYYRVYLCFACTPSWRKSTCLTAN